MNHIGKEANRWEEQFYLGQDPEAEHDRLGWFTATDLLDLDLAHPGYTGLLSGLLAERTRKE